MDNYHKLVDIYLSGNDPYTYWLALNRNEKKSVMNYCAEKTWSGVRKKLKVSAALLAR